VLHPFDLEPHQINFIKGHFPEFKITEGIANNSGIPRRCKGINLEDLRMLLAKVIPVDQMSIDKLIDKLDHKHVS